MDDRLLAACVTVSLVVALFIGIGCGGPDKVSSVLAYTASDPISIQGNSDFTAENGVVGGDGTSGNPYIIEGWEIDLSEASDSDGLMTVGINIQNTDDFFEIRSVSVHSGNNAVSDSNKSTLGILFFNVVHATLRDIRVDDNPGGIDLSFCSQIEVINCSLVGNGFGIRVNNCDSLSILNNSVTDCLWICIDAVSVSDSEIVGNDFSNSTGWTGANLYMAEDCVVNSNTISGNENLGLNLGYCEGCEVKYNIISDNRVGIVMYGSEDMVVEENTFSGNEDNTDFSDENAGSFALLQVVLVSAVVIIVFSVAYLIGKRGRKPELLSPPPGQ